MPEVTPEVEIQVRQLRRKLRGARIRALTVHDRKLHLPASIIGQRIRQVWRRGKFIVFDLNDGQHLLAHLRMTGWFEFEEPARHRVAIRTDRANVYFTDSRRFGDMQAISTRDLMAKLDALGSDAWPTGDLGRLSEANRAVKVALLDQSLLAGVGNIYANEALWRAGISPRRRANQLTAGELRRLSKAIVAAMQQGIRYGPRIFEVQRFAVYDRAGEKCRRCRGKIRRITQAQRSTFFCPSCQH
jgi:formamidopyrimidine-DNA glycosylase